METLNVKHLKEANEMYEKIQTIDKELDKLNSLATRSVHGNLTSMLKIGVIDKKFIDEKAVDISNGMPEFLEIKKGENPLKAIMETVNKIKKSAESIHDELSIDTTFSETSTLRILSLMIEEKKAEKATLQR